MCYIVGSVYGIDGIVISISLDQGKDCRRQDLRAEEQEQKQGFSVVAAAPSKW